VASLANRRVNKTSLPNAVKCVLKNCFICLAVDEVAVKAIACSVTVREDEILVVRVYVSKKEELVKEQKKCYKV
jgi:hypothetical protein